MRLATQEDSSLAIEIICTAFDTNPSVNWVIKNDGKRRKRIRELARYSFNTALRREGAFISSAENGLALCYLPNLKKETIADYFAQLRLTFLAIGVFRVFSVVKRESYTKRFRPADC